MGVYRRMARGMSMSTQVVTALAMSPEGSSETMGVRTVVTAHMMK